MFTMYWVYDLPSWLFGLLCVSVFVAFGLIGLSLTRNVVRRIHGEDHSHNDIVGFYLAAVTVFYGITLGLVAVGTWTNYAVVQDKVDLEAQNIASLYRGADGYPEAERDVLHRDLKAYTAEVIHNSWPQQQKGLIPTGSEPMLDAIQADLQQFQPTTPGMATIHSECYRQFHELVEARRARLDAVESGLPKSLWWLVILGALISITATLFFDLRSLAMHRAMTALMAGLLGLMIFLVATLDNPFRGTVSVRPASLERAYQQLR